LLIVKLKQTHLSAINSLSAQVDLYPSPQKAALYRLLVVCFYFFVIGTKRKKSRYYQRLPFHTNKKPRSKSVDYCPTMWWIIAYITKRRIHNVNQALQENPLSDKH